jgi:LuxR family maltose regulon positive regulatory protein
MSRDNAFDFTKLAANPVWDNQKIASYLMEEVIGNYSEEERMFMLKTSIVSQLCGSLCEELTGCADGQTMLERLSQHNAFLVQADNKGIWYRYHHLFAEFLHSWMASSNQFSACKLHEIAGDWYERNQFIEEAVNHYLQCNMSEKIVAIVERNGRKLLKTGDFSLLKEWHASLPAALIKGNDTVCLIYAWALMLSGSAKEAEAWLSVLEERYLGHDEPPHDVALKKQIEFEIHYFKSFSGLLTDNRESILFSINRMKELVNERITIDFSLNINTGEASLMAGLLGFKGRIRLLDDYVPLYESVRKDVIKQNIGFIPALLGELLFERNQLDDAFTVLIKALDEAESASMPGSFIPAIITMARIMKAKGDLAGAFDLIADAEMKLLKIGRIHFQPILAAFKARISIECEDSETIDQWLKGHFIDLHDAPSIYRIYKQITLARVMVFKKDYDSAILILNRLLVFARKEDNLCYLIEILNLLAITYYAAGQTHKAMTLLQESLLLGEREGYERHYIEEGVAMAALLGRLLRKYNSQDLMVAQSISPLYLRKLLAQTKAYCLTIKAFIIMKESVKIKPTGLIRPLTKREKEILRFISSELTNLEIARILDISLNTVKVNCTAIYRKLQVKNRDQAAIRARELNILN